MDPMNFNILRRNDARESNYTLRDKKVQLTVTCQPLYETPDAGVWEGEGGALPPASYEETVEEVNKRTMRIRGARKQRAARAYVPRESIKIIPLVTPAPVEVAEVRLRHMRDGEVLGTKKTAEKEAQLAREEEIAVLEHKVRKLMDVIKWRQDGKRRDAELKAQSIEQLRRIMEERKVR